MTTTLYRQLAEKAAREAGRILLEGSGLRKVNMQDAKDVKLKADVESEKYIRKLLREGSRFPVIGEEEGGDGGLPYGDQPYWVVDPLDGTYNYLRGWPLTCVSIGLMQGMQPLLGVIYDFAGNQCYVGATDHPLTVNGRQCYPQWADKTDHAVLLTGFPVGRDYSGPALQHFLQDIQRFQKIRMIGSAALALAYVATGRGDVYTEEGIRLWDIAAGLALVKAAGGHVSCQPVEGKVLAYNVWAVGKREWLPKT